MSRLLLMTHCYPKEPGDMRGSFLVPFVENLKAAGIETYVLTPDWGRQGSGVEVRQGFVGEKVFEFPWAGSRLANLSLVNPFSILALLRFLWRWRGALKQLEAQAGGLDGVLAAWGMPAGLMLRSCSVPRQNRATWWLGTDFNRFNKPHFRWLLKFIMKGAGVNWANSQRMVDGLPSLKAAPAAFVPLVNLPPQKASDDTAGAPAARKRVLSIGRLERVKGFDIALQAVARLEVLGLSFDYRLIGDGEERDRLAAMTSGAGNVTLLGYQTDEEVQRELQAADLVLLPSRQEGMPLVFFEALLAGKKIVATDVGDVGRCIEGTGLGWISAPEDVEALAENLTAALASEQPFDQQGANEILETYSPEKAVAATQQLIGSGGHN